MIQCIEISKLLKLFLRNKKSEQTYSKQRSNQSSNNFLQSKLSPSPDGVTGEFCKLLESYMDCVVHGCKKSDMTAVMTAVRLQLLKNTRGRKIYQLFPLKLVLLLLPNPKKDITKKANYKVIFIINIDVKIFNKMPTNQIPVTYRKPPTQ